MNDLKDQVRFSFAVRQTLLGEVREKVSISIFPTRFEIFPVSIITRFISPTKFTNYIIIFLRSSDYND